MYTIHLFKNIYLYTYYGQHMGCLFIQLRVLGAQGQEWYRTLEGVVPKIWPREPFLVISRHKNLQFFWSSNFDP